MAVKTMEDITVLMEKMRFRKKWIGGVDEKAVSYTHLRKALRSLQSPMVWMGIRW